MGNLFFSKELFFPLLLLIGSFICVGFLFVLCGFLLFKRYKRRIFINLILAGLVIISFFLELIMRGLTLFLILLLGPLSLILGLWHGNTRYVNGQIDTRKVVKGIAYLKISTLLTPIGLTVLGYFFLSERLKFAVSNTQEINILMSIIIFLLLFFIHFLFTRMLSQQWRKEEVNRS